MTRLDVLVVESTPGAARQESLALEEAGHRVHSCHEPSRPGFPCRAVTGDACPLDEGVDVGLLVRRGVAPRPTEHEYGVGCIIRAGIPLVEQGSAILDPYEGFLATRIHGDVAAACQAAVDDGFEPLRSAIGDRIDRLMSGVGHTRSDVEIEIQRRGPDLRIELSGPPIPTPLRHALGVRVLDALRGAGRTFGTVDVDYRFR